MQSEGALTILWTDAILWGAYAALFVFLYRFLRQGPLRDTAKKVLCKPVPFIASMLLCVYVIIALLDSIHIQSLATQQTESVLDLLLSPIGHNTETTFSAPLSCHGFVAETIVTDTGELVRDYPRLSQACQHLENIADKPIDLMLRSAMALVLTGKLWLMWMLGSWWLSVLLHRRDIDTIQAPGFLNWAGKPRWLAWLLAFGYPLLWLFHGHTNVTLYRTHFPWKTYALISALLFLLGCWCFYIGQGYHLLGTNKIGQDVFYQALKSIRTGLLIGTVTTVVMLPFAVVLGLMAGYFRGIVDDIIQFIYTTLSAVPSILLIAASVLGMEIFLNRHESWIQTVAMRSDVRLLTLCCILGLTSWTGLCRLLRAEALRLRQLEYVQAATVLGVGHFKILWQHLLPNVMPMILMAITLDFSGLVLAEAVLSYMGIGVDPSTHSWGTMINASRLEMARVPAVWWSLVAAFGFMFGLVLCANLFSDALRDIVDPKMRNA